MKNKFWLGILTIVFATTIVTVGCDLFNKIDDEDIAVTFSAVSADGSSTLTTTQLTLTFSEAISGFSASNITISGVSGVKKGTLSSLGSTYILPISGFTETGTLKVSVSKSGYTISGSPKTVTIYYNGGSSGSDVLNGTTWRATNSDGYYIVVTFNSPNWSMEDNTNNGQVATHTGTYTISGNTVTLTTLTFNGSASSGTQTATISGNTISLPGWPTFTKQDGNGGEVTDSTFTLTSIPSEYNGKYAYLNFYGSGGSGYGWESINMSTEAMTLCLISNGSVSIPLWDTNLVRYTGNDTSNISVVLFNTQTLNSEDFESSATGYIVFSNVTFSNGGATRSWGQGQYTGSNNGGGDTAVTLTSVTPNGSSSETTTQLTLTFSQAITGLTADDISLSGVSGVSKGTLSSSGATYTLPISGFNAGGTLSVAVTKSGYTISDSPKTVTIYYSGSGGGETELNGTWNKDIHQLIIDGNNWQYKSDGTILSQGTISIDTTAKKMSFTLIYEGGTSTTNADYALSGDTLIISNNINNYVFPINGTWTKDNGSAFYSIADMATWLSAKDANTAATAYNVKLNVSSLGSYPNSAGNALNANSTKYVRLDLSGSTITNIGNSAFSGCTSLITLTIPDSVNSIGSSAFSGCTSLTFLTIPDSVYSIGNRAFSGCTSLTSVTIPDSVTWIEDAAFSGCTSLTSLTISDSVNGIGQQAFSGCTSLASVTIPDSVISIGVAAFSNCTSLASVTFQGTIDEANFGSFPNPFLGDLRAKYLAAGGGIGTYTTAAPVSSSSVWTKEGGNGNEDDVFTSIAKMTAWLAVQPANDAATAYTVKLNVADLTGMSNSSFSNKYVNLDLSGSTITSISYSNFIGGNTSLISVTIPDGVTGISNFSYCTNLTAINVAADNNTYSSQDGVLYNKDKTTLVLCPPGKTGAFTIPAGVTSIGDRAFSGCNSLTSVTIPNSVTSIGSYAFTNCTSLTSVAIPNGVTSIGSYAFNSCTSLDSITIPNSVTSISQTAFSGCTNLTAITVDSGNTAYSSQDGVLYNKNKTILVLYPPGKTGDFTIPANVTSIGDGAFSGCIGLASVTIGNNVTTIGSNFTSCTSLIAITVDTGNTAYSSQDGVLYNKAKTILYAYPVGKTGDFIIPDGVTSIWVGAFIGCTGFTGVTIPASVTSIESYAFYSCTSLTSVMFEGTINETNFASSAFFGDLRTKYLATTGGGIGTYTTTAPVSSSSVWTKQN